MDAQDSCARDVGPTLISIPKQDGQSFPRLCPPMCSARAVIWRAQEAVAR